MKIQYMSDLHMELWDNSRFIKANGFDVMGDFINKQRKLIKNEK